MSDTETHLKQHYIGGKWVDSNGGKLHDVINPATEEAASTVVLGTAADVDDAVAAAVDGLAGLGPYSTGDHAPGEAVDIPSIARQATRAAILMSRLSAEKR